MAWCDGAIPSHDGRWGQGGVRIVGLGDSELRANGESPAFSRKSFLIFTHKNMSKMKLLSKVLIHDGVLLLCFFNFLILFTFSFFSCNLWTEKVMTRRLSEASVSDM